MSLKLPVMQCDAGCGECCGIAPCSTEELERVIRYAKNRGIEPVTQGTTCPFYQGGTCTVYEVRPMVCRLFGHVPEMECPRGYNTNISPSHHARIRREYGRKMTVERYLHETVYSIEEINRVLEVYLSRGKAPHEANATQTQDTPTSQDPSSPPGDQATQAPGDQNPR